jgi:RNA polymerase sigma-70 factor (ECF subfamily)
MLLAPRGLYHTWPAPGRGTQVMVKVRRNRLNVVTPGALHASKLVGRWSNPDSTIDQSLAKPTMSLESMPVQGLAITQGGGQSLAELDDQHLIARAQAGDRAAFEALVHRYDRDVLRLILNVLRSPEDAPDVYQEAFLKIYRNLHRFRVESSFFTWAYRIVTNTCLDHLRRRRSRPEDQAPEVNAGLREDGMVSDFFERQKEQGLLGNPEQQMLGQEIGKQIEAAMEVLSPRERLIFEMKHHQGLKLRAIGDALGTTEETVKNSLFRATRKLRAQLQGLQ